VKQMWLLLQQQMRRNTAKTVILVGIVLIMCMISTFSYGKKQEEQKPLGKITLGVANEDASSYARLLITYFTENKNFSSYVTVVEQKKEELEQMLEEGAIDAYLVIPPEFAESLMRMEHQPVEAVISLEQPTKALLLRQVLESYEEYIKTVEINCSALYDRMKEEGCSEEETTQANVDVSLKLIFTALGKDEFFRLRVVESEKNMSVGEGYLGNLVFFFLMFTLLPAGLKLFQLKENGMLKRLKTMRYSMVSILCAGGLPHMLTVAGFLCPVLLLCGCLDAELFFKSLLLFVPVLLILQLAGIYMKKKKDYLFLFSIIMITMAILGGGIVPVEYLPDSFARIAAYLPNYRFAQWIGEWMEVTWL